jgi:hypothetical protein
LAAKSTTPKTATTLAVVTSHRCTCARRIASVYDGVHLWQGFVDNVAFSGEQLCDRQLVMLSSLLDVFRALSLPRISVN